jgi:hypothetical protein
VLATMSLQGIIMAELLGVFVNKFSQFTTIADLIYGSLMMVITAIAARLLAANISGSLASMRAAQHALAVNNRELHYEIAERQRMSPPKSRPKRHCSKPTSN